MWPRVDLDPPVVATVSKSSGWRETTVPEPSPAGSSREPPARGAWRESAMFWLAAASVVVALASFLRDLIAG
jgi:hypothetical protein